MAELSPSVVALLRGHVDSVEQLDVLLLLAGSRDGCTVEQLHDTLKTSRHSVELRLRELERHGIVPVIDSASAVKRFKD